MTNETKPESKFLPTCNLRVVKKIYGSREEQVLQQQFVSALDGSTKWRNIPVVVQHIKGVEF